MTKRCPACDTIIWMNHDHYHMIEGVPMHVACSPLCSDCETNEKLAGHSRCASCEADAAAVMLMDACVPCQGTGSITCDDGDCVAPDHPRLHHHLCTTCNGAGEVLSQQSIAAARAAQWATTAVR